MGNGQNLEFHRAKALQQSHLLRAFCYSRCGSYFGLRYANSMADFKAVSLNAMHSSMEITDQFYSVLNDSEVKNRIGALGKNGGVDRGNDQDTMKLFKNFLSWMETQN